MEPTDMDDDSVYSPVLIFSSEPVEWDSTPMDTTPPSSSSTHNKASKVPMLTPSMDATLSSYLEGAKMTQPLNQIYDKNWKSSSSLPLDDDDGDDMEVDATPPSPRPSAMSEVKAALMSTAPPSSSKKRKALEVRIVDEPLFDVIDDEGTTAVNPKAKPSTYTAATAKVMSPEMINEHQHQLADQTSKVLNESGVRKILAVEKSTLENNTEADALLNASMHDFMLLFRGMDIRVLNPNYVPSIAGPVSMQVPTIRRTHIIKYMRAPIFQLHQRPCVLNDNCISKALMIHYKLVTQNNSKAGPQFPEGTHPFCLREFFTPDEEDQIQQRLKAGESMVSIMSSIPQHMCILDMIHTTNDLAIKASRGNNPITAPVIIQPFQVMVDTPGEYKRQALLSCGDQNLYGMVAPFLEYRNNNYIPFIYHVTLPASAGLEGPSTTKSVYGWAEIDSILYTPSASRFPRGYDGEAPKPMASASSTGDGTGFFGSD